MEDHHEMSDILEIFEEAADAAIAASEAHEASEAAAAAAAAVATAALDTDMAEATAAEADAGQAADAADAAGAAGAADAADAAEIEDAIAANGDAVVISEEREPTPVPTRTTFADYLSSPIIKLLVGGGAREDAAERMELTAHQALLVKSPYFAARCEELDDDRTIALPDQNLDAVGCFLEFLYTGDYFPRKLAGHAHTLESDATLPAVDDTGAQLLKHARVYTLADMLALPELQSLASSKIHCVQSTAQGEIVYARYVYACTRADDTTVRHPVAKFWAMRSHTLRAEAEREFQALCLEFPQFAYDVLMRVLDEKLKRERDDRMYPPGSVSLSSVHGGGGGSGRSSGGGSSGRKRARNSSSAQ